MRKIAKKISNFRKSMMRITASLIILVGLSIGGIYIYLKSISLEDIKFRQLVNSGSVDNTVNQNDESDIPKALEGTVSKASNLAGKSIETQDALDVAAILFNSGLSMREIYFLQGNATYNLSTEEKQKIRDLLLEKLTPEEIELLRNITIKYGKGLAIVDPNYPIEWVGVRDPEKLAKMQEEWHKEQRNKAIINASFQQAQNTSEQEPESEIMPDPLPVSDPESQETDGQSTISEEQLKRKQQIDDNYNQQMRSLQSVCKARSDAILRMIIGQLQSDPDTSISTIQETFLGQVAQAESECDNEFRLLVDQANAEYNAEGLNGPTMPAWQSEYDAAKASTRSAAIMAIADELNKE